MLRSNGNINRILLVLFALLGIIFFPQEIHADDIDVVSSVSATKIGIEDAFYYTITVESTSSKSLDVDAVLKGFPGDYGRPSVSNSMSTSFMNGKMTSSRSQSYKYTIYPEKEGTLNIPEVKVIVNGKGYFTQSHTIEVVSGSLRSQQNTTRRGRSPFSSFFDRDWDDSPRSQRTTNKSFVEVEVSKDTVYVGQNITAKYTYYAVNNNYNVSYEMEDFDGYGIENSETVNENWERVKYKGKNYYRREIVTMIISPQKSGLLTLPIFTVNENMFINQNSCKSPNKKLFVKDLPSKGKGIDFSNAIGTFNMESELAQSIMFENQQNQLILTITGKGNFQKILYPEIPKVDGLEILKPKATLDLKEKGKGILVLSYDIIPSESGKFKLPAASFNYFNDKLGKYQTIYSSTNLLTVKPVDLASVDSNSNTQNTFYSRNKPYLGSITHEYLLTNKISYWLLLAFFLLIMTAYLIFHKVQKSRMSNVGYVRRREALSIMKKAISESAVFVENRDITFYTNAQNNLLKFIAKITKASLQLSQAELIAELEKSSVNKVTVAKINSFLSYCEQIKYRPDFKSNENIKNDYQKFQDIYTEIRNSQG